MVRAMKRREFLRWGLASAAAGLLPVRGQAARSMFSPSTANQDAAWNVSHFGAKGDGAAIDSIAINQAIDAAAKAGGGTVFFPAGVYRSYSIRLKSHVGLFLDHGAVILAAENPAAENDPGYDPAEPHNAPGEAYQDFGHNHWHNSLIWGEGLNDISITGPGMIWGKGLARGFDFEKDQPDPARPGVGSKAIALKNCRNVILRDFTLKAGGWFGILATGVDNLSIDQLAIDSNRDGMDIDCCRNVRITSCTVNTPWDYGICLKSSYALGYLRATEDVTISNCFVTGNYALGSVADATWKPATDLHWPPTGRIKLGTESNGGFRRIVIDNCVFESCRGVAIESVDGAICEDITISNIVMRDVRSAPIFMRLGSRMRAPAGSPIGAIRRVLVSHITSSGAGQIPSILAGIPDHPIEDIQISDCFFEQVGGGSSAMAALLPAELETKYPEPEMFGAVPATGFYLRHVRNLDLSHVEVRIMEADKRPAIWMRDVEALRLDDLRLPMDAPPLNAAATTHTQITNCSGLPDGTMEKLETRH